MGSRENDRHPAGCEQRLFSTERQRDPAEIVFSIARLDDADRIKNIHSVIGAFSGLKDDYDFEYVIIGGETRGNYRQELQSLIDANGLSSKVRLEGRKTDAELVQYYRDADLFVLVPYAERNNFEGFGIVFLEANASGVPVLTSREGGMKDYVKKG
jgi:phosphatidylinositol alpha-1,6-mannosyltransferase